MSADLSVVILNWNTRGLLEKCLRSLACPQQGIAVEVIVVDNASEDGSRELVTHEFPQVRLIVNKKNVGFGAGNNAALPHTRGRYVLFLNSDTVVMEGALTALVRYADANPDAGILGPKLLNGDGSLQYSCRRYPNLAAGFFRNTPLGRLFPNNRFASDYLMQDWDHATPRDVDWVSGAALMIRRTLLDRIGGFDEEFYMYCEDVDLCWRANHEPYVEERSRARGASETPQHGTSLDRPATGRLEEVGGVSVVGAAEIDRDGVSRVERDGAGLWRVTYVPDAVIYHLIGKSSDQAPTRMTYEFHRSQYLFYRKHYRVGTPWPLRPIIPVGIMLRAAGQMARYRANYWRRKLKRRGEPGRH